jgi:hypothetical protein
MVLNCSPLFLSIVPIMVIIVTFGMGWRWIVKVRKEGTSEFDRNSMLLISLLSVALVSVFIFIFYVFFRSFVC